MSNKKLADAAKAIERAYRASEAAVAYPSSYGLPCRVQLAAAQAEIDCAVALISEWKKSINEG